MNPLEVRVLNSVRSFLGHLDRIIDRHPVLVAIGILNLFVLLGALFIVYVVRRRAKGLIKPGPPIIFIESSAHRRGHRNQYSTHFPSGVHVIANMTGTIDRLIHVSHRQATCRRCGSH